jgi:hypothetical protein
VDEILAGLQPERHRPAVGLADEAHLAVRPILGKDAPDDAGLDRRPSVIIRA